MKKKIFVSSSFKQKEGDMILYQTDDLVCLEVEKTQDYKEFIFNLTKEGIAEIENSLKQKYLKALNLVCDDKSQQSKTIIAGMGVSAEQMEEYSLVEYALEKNDTEWFADEAKMLGTTAKAEFARAKKQAGAYKLAHTSFKKLIRLYRRYVAKKIDEAKFNEVLRLIEQGKEIGVDVEGTPTEVFTACQEQVNEIISN